MDKSASNSNVFEGSRGHVRHRYEVRDDALYYSAGEPSAKELHKQVVLPWHELERLGVGHAQSLYLVKKNKQSFGLWVDPERMPAFLEALFAAWMRKAPETARKAAFDYGAQEPAVGWIWLVLSLSFPGLLALVLLTDGYHERKCTNLLNTTGQVTQAQVLKIKKNRRGNFIWTMEFETSAGKKVSGTREAPITDPTGAPVGSKDKATVIYAGEDLSCWDLSLKPGQRALDNRERSFIVFMDMTFGWIFAVVAAIATALSVRRIRRRHPYREIVRAALEHRA